MTAARIREAAKVLRDAAENATPGPWAVSKSGQYVCGDHPEVADSARVIADAGTDWPDRKSNAIYIALMQPAVALALADWLSGCAFQEERLNGGPGAGPVDPRQRWRPHQYTEALTLADTILGGKS